MAVGIGLDGMGCAKRRKSRQTGSGGRRSDRCAELVERGGRGWNGTGGGWREMDGMGWDGMGQEGMGWDGMGWDGMGMEGKGHYQKGCGRGRGGEDWMRRDKTG